MQIHSGNMDGDLSDDDDGRTVRCSSTINTKLLPYKIYYFFFFGSIGSFYPYLGPYFKQTGLTAPQTGILIGLRCLVQSIGLPFWGVLADSHRISMRIIFLIGLLGWMMTNASIYSISAGRASCFGANNRTATPNTSTTTVDVRLLIFNRTVEHHLLLNTSRDVSDVENGISQGENVSFNSGKTRVEKRRILEILALLKLVKPGDIGIRDRMSTNLSYFNNATDLSQILDDFEEPLGKTKLPPLFRRSKREIVRKTTGSENMSFPGFHEDTGQPYGNIFVSLVIVIVIGHLISSPAQTFANIATLETLGKDSFRYGTQRAFGAVGWGVLSFITGIFLQSFSSFPCLDTENPSTRFSSQNSINYTPIFIAFQACMSITFMVSLLIDFKSDTTNSELNIDEQDVDENLLSEDQQVLTAHTVVVVLTALVCGINKGFIDSFLAWHLVDLGGTALLFSVMFALETLGDTVGFLGAGRILQHCGPSTGICLGLIGYIIRQGCYGFVVNPWIVLCVEILKAFTSAILWSSLVAYVGLQENCAATLQSVLHGAYWGLGNSAGGIFGGFLVSRFGAPSTFLGLSGLSSLQLLIFAFVHNVYRRRTGERYQALTRRKYSMLNAYE